MTIRGRVQNGVVLLPKSAGLPDGTDVEVTPLGPAQTVLATSQAAPPYRVSNEQRDALLRLIGIWKSDLPPGDEDVDRIIDEYRSGKHG